MIIRGIRLTIFFILYSPFWLLGALWALIELAFTDGYTHNRDDLRIDLSIGDYNNDIQ